MAAGEQHTVVVLWDGRVLACGANWMGQVFARACARARARARWRALARE